MAKAVVAPSSFATETFNIEGISESRIVLAVDLQGNELLMMSC
jgi:hypothetical protein